MPNSLVEEVMDEFEREQHRQWKPFPGAQTRFLSCPAFEVFFGGAAGPGKTQCLVMDALRQVTNPLYRGVLFRRTMTELDDADGPIQRSHEWYPLVGGIWKEGKKKWVFPHPNSPRRIGAEIYFHHMEHEQDRFKYQGAQYQYIGFDELTHFTEKQYIYLHSRARTVKGSGLEIYIRGASNPGGEGHVWVKNRFVNRGITNQVGYFLRINGEDIAVPVGTPNAKSRSFIPATLRDNPMITQDYMDNLMSLPEIERKRLMDGDWDAEYRGRVYDNFTDENISMDADFNPNYPFEVWIDDGYHHPRAMLFVQERPFDGFPDRLCIFAEIYETGVLHKDAIEHMLSLYGEPEMVIYDPNALYLARELQEAGLVNVAGYNNIDEGIKGVRQFICDGNGVRTIFIHPRCRNLIRELGEYQFKETDAQSKDPKPEQKNDHACFVAGTMITTANGQIPIEQVKVGDVVLTRQGWNKVLASEQTSESTDLMQVILSDGRTLTATPDHPIWVKGQSYTELRALRYGDIIETSDFYLERYPCPESKKSPLTELSSVAIQTLSNIHYVPTSFRVLPTASKAWADFTRRYGNRFTGIFQKVITSITRMKTRLITTFLISNVYLQKSITATMPNVYLKKNGTSLESGLKSSDLSQARGMVQKRDELGIASTVSYHGLGDSLKQQFVKSAKQVLKPLFLTNLNTAPINAGHAHGDDQAQIMLNGYANTAAMYLASTNMNTRDFAPVSVVAVITLPDKQAVYNLKIDDTIGEYFANGILAKNCDALRYGIATSRMWTRWE